MRITLFLLFSLICYSSMFSQKTLDELLQQYNTRSIPYISVEELFMLRANGDVLVLDTREETEFQVSHISGSKLVGFNTFSTEKTSEEISDKNTPIVVYCSLGIRSEEIGEKLKKAGYTNVKNLYGGIFEWKNKAYPIVDSTNTETENVHTFSKPWGKWLKKGIKTN